MKLPVRIRGCRLKQKRRNRNPKLRADYDKKREEGKPHKAAIACAYKLIHWIDASLHRKRHLKISSLHDTNIHIKKPWYIPYIPRLFRLYPIEPSISNLIRRFISTAYSIGSSFVKGSMKPITIISVASCSETPRLMR